MSQKFLTALPVFNERQHVDAVLDQVVRHSPQVLVVDDGSTDGTAARLARRRDVQVVTHPQNRGYGAALRSAFQYAIDHHYEVLVTIDCDGQHEPQRIPQFVQRCLGQPPTDIVSGSRYLQTFPGDVAPPAERRSINHEITAELNRRLGLEMTDAFCGFKAYRVAALPALLTDETGYAMPLEVWMRAADAGLRIVEFPVPLIYLEEKRSFGGELDDGRKRLEYYYRMLDRGLLRRSPACDAAGGGPVLCGESTG